MILEPEITLCDIPPSDAIQDLIQKNIDKLNEFDERIMHCHVVVKHAQNHKNNGKLYNVRLEITVPGEKIVSNHTRDEDINVAIRDAFKAVRRQLQDYASRRRGDVKAKPLTLHGFITKIFFDNEFGFIESNGVEYYFSPSNLAHSNFAKLDIGTEVTFLENVAAEGLQANRVTIGKHHGLEQLE